MSKLERHISWHDNGQVHHIYYGTWDGMFLRLHGEYKKFAPDGKLESHMFFKDNDDITEEVEKDIDINCILEEDKMFIKLKWGIKCLR